MTATMESAPVFAYDDLPDDPAGLRVELLARARALVPALRERAWQTEHDRYVCEETVADLRAAGLLRVATPEMFGGYPGIDYDLVGAIAFELGRGCMSTAWCYNVWLSHNWMVGTTDLRLQAEYFADGPDVLSSTASSPIATKIGFTDDGYVASGHWSFASGSKHSQWFFCAQPEMMGAFAIPRKDVEVLDTWRSSGLAGTGSNEILVEHSEVPSHRVWSPLDDGSPMGSIGWATHGRPSYRLPMWMFTYTILAPMIGAAHGALEAFQAKYAGTVPRPGPQPTTRHSGVESLQVAYAESSAEAETAALLWRSDIRRVLDQAEAGIPFTLEDRARVRRNQVYAAKLAIRCVTRLFETTGAHALIDTDPLQRCFRDVHAAGHHITLPFEYTMAGFGSVALGRPFAMDFQRDGIDRTLIERPASGRP